MAYTGRASQIAREFSTLCGLIHGQKRHFLYPYFCMSKRFPAWLFLAISLAVTGIALLPIIRVAIGLDSNFAVPFLSTVTLLIGGLMSGLTGMILLVRKPPVLDWSAQNTPPFSADHRRTLKRIHASGLFLYSGIPLANFFVCYWLWSKHRYLHPRIDSGGRAAVNFQITIYLYLLLSLFMVFAVIGILTTPLILLLHLIATLCAITAKTNASKEFSYPANIPVIEGRQPGSSST